MHPASKQGIQGCGFAAIAVARSRCKSTECTAGVFGNRCRNRPVTNCRGKPDCRTGRASAAAQPVLERLLSRANARPRTISNILRLSVMTDFVLVVAVRLTGAGIVEGAIAPRSSVRWREAAGRWPVWRTTGTRCRYRLPAGGLVLRAVAPRPPSLTECAIKPNLPTSAKRAICGN